MPEKFDVSPAYVILYLKDIEQKLRRKYDSQYPLPHYIGGEIPEEALNVEAKKMMEYVGLTTFTPQCCWEDIKGTTAGYIELNGSKSGPAKIHISSRYKCNGKATIAILAHEICHKLLEFHSLYFPNMTWLNETYTDLCTIYVGFTQLIVNGYNTTEGSVSFSLGYLSKNTFERTIAVMDLIRGRRAIDRQWTEGTDEFSQLARWLINPDKRKSHIDGFAKRQLAYAGLNKRVLLLNRLLKDIMLSYNPTLKDIDLRYFFDNPSYGEGSTVSELPLTLFCMSHPELFKQPDELKAREAECMSVRLDRAIRAFLGSSKIKNFELQSDIHVCPFCLNEFTMKRDGRKWRVIKCNKCGNRFALDMTEYQLLPESAPRSSAPPRKWWQFWKPRKDAVPVLQKL